MTKFYAARSFPLHSIFTHPFGHSRPVYDAPGEGGGGAPTPAPTPASTPTPAPTSAPTPEPNAEPVVPKAGDPITDEVAKLLKDTMKHKKAAQTAQEKLAAYGQVTPEEVAAMLAEKRTAAEKKTADELAAAEARGEFDRVKQSMTEQHNTALEAISSQVSAKETELSAAQATISELTVGAAFGNSSFIREKLVLTPAKARTVYGAHFETEGTKVVAYDKPRGAADRTPVVDAAGNKLPFEAAIAKLVELDADKDHLLRSTMPTGAGSKTTDSTKAGKETLNGATELTGAARIKAALAAKKAAVSA